MKNKSYAGAEIKLKDCPFCGGEAKITHIGNELSKSRKVVISCKKCGVKRTDAAMRHGFSWLENVAVIYWNSRFSNKN